MNKNRFTFFVVLGLVLMLLLTACGSKVDNSANNGGDTDVVEAVDNNTEVENASEDVEEPVVEEVAGPSGTLVWALTSDPPSSSWLETKPEQYVYQTMFNALVRYSTEDFSIEPDLAASWEVDDQGLVWVFYLRDDVLWHDGEQFTAEDVKFSFETILNPDVNAGYHRGNLANVESIEVLDDFTLKITMINPDFDFFLHVRSWSVTLCKQFKDQCVKDAVNNDFTLHGVWPNRNNGTYPAFCDGAQFDWNNISDLKTDLDTYWTDYKESASYDDGLWAHEFNKHGTCAEFNSGFGSEHEYFFKGIEAAKALPIVSVLADGGIYPDDYKEYESSDIVAILKKEYGHESIVECSRDSNDVEQIVFCMNTDLSLMDCTYGAISCANPCTGRVRIPKTI